MHYQGVARLLAPFDPATDPLSGPLRRYLATGDESAIEEVVRQTRPRLLPAATVRTRLRRARRLVRSRWSPALVAGLFSLPWFLLDQGRDAAGSSGALAAGGVMSLKLAAPLLALGLAVGAGAAYLARPSA